MQLMDNMYKYQCHSLWTMPLESEHNSCFDPSWVSLHGTVNTLHRERLIKDLQLTAQWTRGRQEARAKETKEGRRWKTEEEEGKPAETEIMIEMWTCVLGYMFKHQ